MVAPVIKTAEIEGKKLTMCLTNWADMLSEKYDIPRGGFDWRYRQVFNCDLQKMIDAVSGPRAHWEARNHFLYGALGLADSRTDDDPVQSYPYAHRLFQYGLPACGEVRLSHPWDCGQEE